MENPQKREGEHEENGPEEASSEPMNTTGQNPTGQSDAPAAHTPEEAPAAQPEKPEGGNKAGSKLIFALIVAGVAAILVGAYLYATNSNPTSGLQSSNNQAAATSSDLTELLNLEKTEPVARVNGEDLSWKDYEQSLNEVLQNTSSAGADVSNPQTQSQIKQQALASLVNTELLLQAAEDEGVSVPDSEVQSEFDNIQQQLGGEAELDRMLEQFKLTRGDLRTSISEQIAINEYIGGEIDLSTIEVTEEEVQTMYDQVSAGAQEGQIPPLQEVRGAIESQIQSTKRQELIATLIESLREVADIETLL